MFRRALKPLATTTLLVGPPSAYIYYRYTTPSKPQTFDVSVRELGPDGKPMKLTRSFNLLPMSTVNTRITEHATLKASPDLEGKIWKYTTARLSSNDPIEDANAEAIISKISNASGSTTDQLMFSAVMDGHAGVHTSQLLSRVLLPAVSLELAKLVQETSHTKSSALEYLSSVFSLRGATPERGLHVHPSPEAVSLAIQRAFDNLDFEIVNGPLRILAANANHGSKGIIPDLSRHPMALASMLPALSGSCAIMAAIDPALDDIYVACTGDCRAVAGIWEEPEDGTAQWRVEVLSQDQTGRNPNELKRLQSEHPVNEADDVVRRGRILGGLEPSRAFGDARYKWPRQVQEALNHAFLVGNDKPMRNPPPLLKTPPYVTATPVVTHRKLGLHTRSSKPAAPPRSSLRFLVLATDGLWDELSSEEVVALVGGYLAGVKGTIPKSSLSGLVPTTSGSRGVEGKEKRREKQDGSWAFVDDNVSAHLIRNAFGGGDEDRLRKMLSIPSPHSRRYRDDVTVTVVWWEAEAEASTSTRAKL
ncbi:phosphatase 2C-like domain-containing protein [Amylostereum chailletii]|nr:phosphatase 2C-like domain-containing protein [Amylostereum chailletii]